MNVTVPLSLGVAALAACAPVSADRAHEICSDRARAALGPTGRVMVGIGSDGPAGTVEIGISSDYLRGRDPGEVYEACIRRYTGAPPTQAPDFGAR